MTPQKLTFSQKTKIILNNLRGITVKTNLAEYSARVEKILKFDLAGLDDGQLRSEGLKLRNEASSGKAVSMEYLFAVCAEAFRRTLGIEIFDVQLIAGMAMAQGELTEMGTGEGKTAAAVFAACFQALSGGGVHVLTANEYLAGRDAEWMGPVYRMLGFTVDSVKEKDSFEKKKQAYRADMTYLTIRQAGFDYLSDKIAYSTSECLHRQDAIASFALIDEADFIMIDEARIPLILASKDEEEAFDPWLADRLVKNLSPISDFKVDRKGRKSFLTIEGKEKICRMLNIDEDQTEEVFHMNAAVNVALHAYHLLHKDIDYIVRDERIDLIDENTGRVAEKRKWPYGIQTALEIKERIKVQDKGIINASVTVRDFIGMYPKLAAMTATALPAAHEFKNFYDLDTVIIPPAKPSRLERKPDRIFTDRYSKHQALIEKIREMYREKRPVLVGTSSVRESEEISSLLAAGEIRHHVLNARNDAEEAKIIAQAGCLSAVTISTNMAGRGTDIRLGEGNPEQHKKVSELGGLYIIGTNRHESRRIDDQLSGRAGRQGDPGTACFYISLDDPLITKYAIRDFIPANYLNGTEKGEIFDRQVVREIDRAQEIIENEHFAMRKNLSRYSRIINEQRKVVEEIRRQALFSGEFPQQIIDECQPVLDENPDPKPGEKLLVRIFLKSLDEFWRDHLLKADLLRDGLHWRRFVRKEPVLEFIRECTDSFRSGLAHVPEKTAKTFCTVKPEEYKTLMSENRFAAPSSTWTYTINDEALPGFRLSMASAPLPVQAAGTVGMIFAAPFYLIAMLLKKIFGRKK